MFRVRNSIIGLYLCKLHKSVYFIQFQIKVFVLKNKQYRWIFEILLLC